MSNSSIIGSLVIISLLSSQVRGESPGDKSELVPLDKIWAWEMPGTRDIFDVDPNEKRKTGGGIVGSIRQSSWLRFGNLRPEELKAKNWARSGFAVAGSGRAPLQAAHAIFVDGQKPRDKFSSDEDISIFFFSEPPSAYRIRLHQIQRKGNQIEIRYQLDPTVEKQYFDNFALIPLGKLSEGKYRVETRQLPHELTPVETKYGFKPLDEEWARNFLCKPFRFAVVEKRK